MIRCHVAAAGTIELYFYGELAEAERARVDRHLLDCAECRQALDDLATIRAALTASRTADAPPGGDWTRFMAGLEVRVHDAPHPQASAAAAWPSSMLVRRTGARAALAAAAALALATAALTMNERGRDAAGPDTPASSVMLETTPPVDQPGDGRDPALLAATTQHFQRSKVVVLGLATRDASARSQADWAYERDLAAALLDDTHVYRIAAETRGLTSLSGIMRDLELVLLEASMTGTPDATALEQVQGLIRRRDLVAKLHAADMAAPSRYP